MKRKINKKNLTKFLLGIIVILMGILALVFFKGKSTKKYYNEYVLVTKNTDLYNSKNKSVGKIYKNAYLELDKFNSKKYFKIKDSDYYVYYKDIKKSKKKDNNVKDYYVTIGISIEVNDNTDYYLDNKAVFKINKGTSH